MKTFGKLPILSLGILLIILFSCKKKDIPPTADFSASATAISKDESVKFTDQSTNSPTTWNWNFGDGGTSSEQNPDHTYLIEGSYTVSLTSTNDSGSDSEVKNDFITVSPFGSVKDIEDNKYTTIEIGTQIWMAENLKTTKYNDGTTIPLVTDFTSWETLITPAYCWYENDEASYKNKYGALYNFFTIETGKLCPSGWHVPTDDEWRTLVYFVGGFDLAGSRLKSIVGWKTGPSVFPANVTLFTVLPAGERTKKSAIFRNDGEGAYFWSSSGEPSIYDYPWGLSLYDDDSNAYGVESEKQNGYSIRCLKD